MAGIALGEGKIWKIISTSEWHDFIRWESFRWWWWYFEKVYDDGRITLEKVSDDGDDMFEKCQMMPKTYEETYDYSDDIF